MEYFSRLKRGFLIFGLYDFLSHLVFAFALLFFRQQGYSLASLVALYALQTALRVVLIPCFSQFPVKKFLLVGFLCSTATAGALLWNHLPYSFWLYGIFLGLSGIFFWVPFNYLFFTESRRETNAVDSAFYTLLPAILAIILPPLSALIIRQYGYPILFSIGLLLSLFITMIIFYIVKEQVHHTRWQEDWLEFKSLKILTCCEGALQFFGAVIIPVYALLFLKSAVQWGWFLSYAGLVGFLIALLLSYRSDRTQRRKKYLSITLLLFFFSIMLLPLMKSMVGWLVAVGIYTLLENISYPLRLAVSLDSKQASMGFWKMREFFLNVGRTVMLGIAAVLLWKGWTLLMFLMFGLMMLGYVGLVNYKLKEVR